MQTNYNMPLFPVSPSSSSIEFSVLLSMCLSKNAKWKSVNVAVKRKFKKRKEKIIRHFSMLVRVKVQWYTVF